MPRTASKSSRSVRRPTRPAAPAPDPSGGELIDLDRAIALLRTTRPTFYRWLREGKIKAMKAGRQWRFYRGDVERFLKGEQPRIELTGDIDPLLDALNRRLAVLKVAPQPLTNGESNKAAAAVDRMIQLAVAMGGTDLHLHPLNDGKSAQAILRIRVDGVLYEIARFDLRILAGLMQRWKTLCACDSQEQSKVQHGVCITTVNGAEVKIFICFLPALQGETVTARFLAAEHLVFTIDQLDYSPPDAQRLVQAMKLPWGLIVVSGPAGNGKTTTLYSALSQCDRQHGKILTIEDPVECAFTGWVQVQLNPAAGVTYASALRAAQRSAPNIVMAGEARDREVLDLLLMLALTGHLALTTLHTDDAASALVRMIEMGADASVINNAVKLIVAQRLIRRLCPKCSVEAEPEPTMLQAAADMASAGGVDFNTLPKHFRKPAGCRECNFTGYRGRMLIAETLEISLDLAVALRNNAPARELRRLAIANGMTSLAADGIRRAAEGATTIEEVLRVAPRT